MKWDHKVVDKLASFSIAVAYMNREGQNGWEGFFIGPDEAHNGNCWRVAMKREIPEPATNASILDSRPRDQEKQEGDVVYPEEFR